MRTLSSWCLVFAVLLSGCQTYRVTSLPPVADHASTGRLVCVLAEPTAGELIDWKWQEAAIRAQTLEALGFRACILSDLTAAPPDTPVLQNFAPNWTSCWSANAEKPGGAQRSTLGMTAYVVWGLSNVFSLGVIPHLACANYGFSADLRRTPEAPPIPIDTRFSVPYVNWLLASVLLPLPQFSASPPPSASADHANRMLRAAILDALEPAPRVRVGE